MIASTRARTPGTWLENPGGTLGGGVQQTVAGTARSLQRGYQSGLKKHGEEVSFSPGFNSIPVVMFRLIAGRNYAAARSASDQRPIMRADNLSASGFTLHAQILTPGTQTSRSEVFTSPLTASSIGAEVGPATLNNAPSYNHSYRVRFSLQVSCTTTPEFPTGSTKATVAVDVEKAGVWTERSTVERTVSRTTSGTTATTFSPIEVDVAVTDLVSTDRIRLRMKNIEIGGLDTVGSATVEGFDNAPTSEGYGVTYTTQSGGTEDSMTPLADDSIKWEAWEAV